MPPTTAADDGGGGGDGDETTTTEPETTTTSTTEPEADLEGSTVIEEPTEPWPDPELPPEPSAQADFTEQIKYEVATVIIEAGGQAADDTTVTCQPEPIPTDVAGPAATCDVTYLAVDTSAAVEITSPGDTFISYEVTVEEAPLTIEKAEWEAAFYAGGDKAVCDMDDVEAFPVDRDLVTHPESHASDRDGIAVDLDTPDVAERKEEAQRTLLRVLHACSTP